MFFNIPNDETCELWYAVRFLKSILLKRRQSMRNKHKNYSLVFVQTPFLYLSAYLRLPKLEF